MSDARPALPVNPHDIEDRINQLRWMIAKDMPEERDLSDYEFQFLDDIMDTFADLEESIGVDDDDITITSEMLFSSKQAELFDRIWKEKVLERKDY